MRTLVEVMDRLRSPGGCDWDAAQTHASLAPYALEEAHEVVEAIESGDRAGMREELGDVLLQVVFHARLAQEDLHDPFDLDDVAADVAAKLVRRHPQVFAASGPRPAEAPDPPAGPVTVAPAARLDGLHVAWDRAKAVEKQRSSVLEGIPLAQGALARGQKVFARARRAGLEVPRGEPATDAHDLGARLLALVVAADAAGFDAEAALRGAVRGLEAQIRTQEAARRALADAPGVPDGASPGPRSGGPPPPIPDDGPVARVDPAPPPPTPSEDR